MPQNTTCQIGAAHMGHTCPQGPNFEVKNLVGNGGSTICTNPSCPYQQEITKGKVHTAIVGGEGNQQHVIVVE